MDPSGGIGLNQPCNIRDRKRRWHSKKNMHMVLSSVHDQRSASNFPNDASQICVQIALNLRMDRGHSLLGAEDEMYEQVGRSPPGAYAPGSILAPLRG